MDEQTSTLSWINSWFTENCDGDWEHENQIIIQTVSNPGWLITVDLTGTDLEDLVGEYTNDVSETDWFFYTVIDSKFTGSGDPSKLETILKEFQKFATTGQ